MAVVAGAGCSSMGGGDKTDSQDLSQTGPSIVNARLSPEKIELNRQFAPPQPVEVLAEVKDFTSPISDVKLRFLRVPMEIPMKHVNGTTWRAELTPQQLKTLAVGGQTITYQANVIARNENGQIAVSREPIDVAVAAPDLAQPTG